MRSDLPKHFNSILHRDDPEIPERDTDEYNAILDRSFTKPDPTQYLFELIYEEVPNVIECRGCENIFVPGPGYDEHLQVKYVSKYISLNIEYNSFLSPLKMCVLKIYHFLNFDS